MLPVTLVTGPGAALRERAIAARLEQGSDTAIILEGLAEAGSPLADFADLPPDAWRPAIHRIAPGCLCCAGNLVLRVTLNRILRRPPAQLFISLADPAHVGQLRASLSAAPYDTLLCLGADLAA
ncbi:P-loop NTPase family protein [Massilia endophytica]|uniref:GTPase n=1 Tax=Massilia endophytica TaxID=2899220 RepID=UPI001E5E9601|nr:GTPase [Massilia endophytica]UGQ47030.1 GTPase [Massilia endophytica]